jgi:hypothetical protein
VPLLALYAFSYKAKNIKPIQLLFVLSIIILGLLITSYQCSLVSLGKKCFVTNNGILNMAIRASDAKGVFFQDPNNIHSDAWYPPGLSNLNLKKSVTLQIAPYDGVSLIKYVISKISANPLDFILKGFENLKLSLFGTIWPSFSSTIPPPLLDYFQPFFMFITLAPCCFILLSQQRYKENDVIINFIKAVLLGFFMVTFATVGEVRYRISIDPFLIILSTLFFSKYVSCPSVDVESKLIMDIADTLIFILCAVFGLFYVLGIYNTFFRLI